MNIDRFAHPDLKIPTAVGCGLGLAIGLGVWAGSGDFRTVGLVAVTVGIFAYLLFFQQHTWKVALFLCFAQFLQIGFGFNMTELEMTLVLAALFAAVTWWRKSDLKKPPALDHWSFGWFNAIATLWLAYLFGHTLFNIYVPYRPQDYALKNLLKTTEMWAGPLLIILYFSKRPFGMRVRRNFPVIIAGLLLAALVINSGIRLYHFAIGEVDSAFDPNDPSSALDAYVTIPVLGLMENVFSLRTLSPLAMLFAGAFTTTRWFREQSPRVHRLFYAVMTMAIIGSAISGGRATLVMTMVLFLGVLVIRGRLGMIFASGGIFVMIIAAANVMPGVMQNAPPLLKRSINWALIERDAEASDSISGSSDWRLNLFHSALAEWRSDPRIFWFGRATYAYGEADYVATLLQGEEGKMQSALRRGATHNLITDLLIAYGLIGFALYVTLIVSYLYLLWVLYRSGKADECARTLALVIFVEMTYTFVVGLIGGTNFPPSAAWLYVVLIGYLYYEHLQTLSAMPPAAIEPRREADRLPAHAIRRRPAHTHR